MIGYKIRRLREAKNYRQEYMAEKLNISQNAYSRIENGETKLEVERLKRIAEVLEVPAEELLNAEPMVFTFNYQHGNNGYVVHDNAIPEKLLERIEARYDAHVKELQQVVRELQRMNERLVELLEKKMG